MAKTKPAPRAPRAPALGTEDIRDRFAMAALIGFTARSQIQGVEKQIARMCYAMADEMMLIKNPPPEPEAIPQ